MTTIQEHAAAYVESFRAEFGSDPDLDNPSDREHCDTYVDQVSIDPYRQIRLDDWRSAVTAACAAPAPLGAR